MNVVGGEWMKKLSWYDLPCQEVLKRLSDYCVIVTPDDFYFNNMTALNVNVCKLKVGVIGKSPYDLLTKTDDLLACSRMVFEETPYSPRIILKDRNPSVVLKEVRRSEYIHY
jgi:hypothetical protein